MGIVKFKHRGKLKVYGKQSKVITPKLSSSVADHVMFLNGIFTNDIKNLGPSQFNYNLMLDEKGFPVDEFFVLCFGDYFILDFEGDTLEKIEKFNKLKLSLKVYFEQINLNHYFVWGEDAIEFLGDNFGIQQLPERFHFMVKDDSIISRNPLRLGIDGFDIITDREFSFQNTEEEFEDLRIQNCIPKINKELKEGIIPLETNIWRYAINFNKGCYTGQEVIARIFYRGKPPRRMVKLKLSNFVEPDTDIIFEGKKVGVVTSVNKELIGLGFILNPYISTERVYSAANAQIKLLSECVELDIK